MIDLLKIKQTLHQEGFGLYPPLEIETEFFESNPNGKVSSLNKKLRQCTPVFDVLWKHQLDIIKAFHDLPFMSRTVSNEESILYTVGIYAQVDHELQRFNKELRKHKSNQDVVAYYKQFKWFLDSDIFDVMLFDLVILTSDAARNLNSLEEKYPGFPWPDNIMVKFVDIKAKFKETQKKLKESD